MPVWEQILLLIAAATLVIFALAAQFGRGGRPARTVFLISSLAVAWFFFRFRFDFPEPGEQGHILPRDAEAVLALLPALWLMFSAIFAREDYQLSLRRNRNSLLIAGILGAGFAAISLFYPLLVLRGFAPEPHRIFLTRLGQWFFPYLIVVSAMTMINLESTYRASWGIYRRKLRPSIFLLGLILIIMLLAASLILLSGEINRQFLAILAGVYALTGGVVFLYFRKYESQQAGVFVRRSAIYSSVAIIIIGFYLVLAGAIGKVIQIIGGDIKLFISVLGAMATFFALLALFLSRSIKERIKLGLERTFHKGQLDFENELASFSEDIATILDPEELTDRILRLLKEKLGVGKLYLFYTDPTRAALRLIYPRDDKQVGELTISAGGLFADWIFRHGEAMVMEDLAAKLSLEKSPVPELEALSRLEVSITLPLIAKQRLIGILFLGPKVNREPFQHQEIQFLSSIGHQFSLALFSARLSEELLAARQIESFHKFTAYIMHDLKNSVSMLSMLLQNYEANIGNPEFQKSAMSTVAGAVKRMQTVMEKLRGGEESERLQLSHCNLNEIVLTLEKRLNLEQQSRIEYHRQLAEQASVQADPDKLTEVVRNLILNALEAMPEGGKLELRTGVEGDYYWLEVADTGEGMSSEFIAKKLFRPFSTSKAKGLGIGLYQSRDWVERMGGRILVDSTPGVGTTFRILFEQEQV